MTDPKEKEAEKETATPAADGGFQTPVDPEQRLTGQGVKQETKNAAPEAPGARSETPGAPNQGTEAR